jgi:hypothetical protein
MDARTVVRGSLLALLGWFSSTCAESAAGATFRTTNFTVEAPTAELAREIGVTAERNRRDLAREWLGRELENWSEPCPIRARVAPQLGAGGATSFVFDGGEVFGWRMNIQGSRERILDSVLPHEVTHTVFASHFRRPVPRWADEGACTTVEHRSEIGKQERMLIDFLKTRRGIPFSEMFAMKEYPQDVLPLYAQGHSLAHLLILERGKRAFVGFLEDGLTDENWPRAVQRHYGYPNLLALQNAWLGWIRAGRPREAARPEGLAAAAGVGPAAASAELLASAAAPGTVTAAPSGRGESPITAGEAAPIASPYEAAVAVGREAASRGFRGEEGVAPQVAGDAPPSSTRLR